MLSTTARPHVNTLAPYVYFVLLMHCQLVTTRFDALTIRHDHNGLPGERLVQRKGRPSLTLDFHVPFRLKWSPAPAGSTRVHERPHSYTRQEAHV